MGRGRRKRLSRENFKQFCSDTRKQGILATTGSCPAGESNKQEITGENRRLGNFQWIEIETCMTPQKNVREKSPVNGDFLEFAPTMEERDLKCVEGIT